MFDLIRLMIMVHALMPVRQQDRAQLMHTRERRMRSLLRHAREASPFYRKRLAGLDLDLCRLSDIAPTSKAELMGHFDDVVTDRRVTKSAVEAFIADPANLGKLFLNKFAICHTSGSQGQPALIVQDKYAMMLNFAVQFSRGTAVKRKWFPHFQRIMNPARIAIVTQRPGFYPSGAAFSYLPRATRPFIKVERLSVFDAVEENVRRLNALKPNFLVGYTSSLEILAREQQAGRLQLRESGALQQITNISEPLPDMSRATIEDAFGVRISDQYAMGECLALTHGCLEFGGSHLNADLAILEVVDDDYRPVRDGEAGHKVLLTNLYNLTQPFIRYEIDDVVTLAAEPCPCGAVFPRIQSIAGRSKDKLWIKDGTRYRELPYYIFLAALHHDLDLAEHQVLQVGVNEFVLRAAPQEGKTLSQERLAKLVHQSVAIEGLADLLTVRIELVDRIARGLSGKVNRSQNIYGPPPAPLDDEPVGRDGPNKVHEEFV